MDGYVLSHIRGYIRKDHIGGCYREIRRAQTIQLVVIAPYEQSAVRYRGAGMDYPSRGIVPYLVGGAVTVAH